MYTIHEIKHDENYIVTSVTFTKSNSASSCKMMFELLPGPDGFIPYENITEEIVVEWLENHSDMYSVDFALEKALLQASWISDTVFPWN
jgi:hypothetical protein